MKTKVVPTSPKQNVPDDRTADVEAFMRGASNITRPTVVRFSASLLILVVFLSIFASGVGVALFAYGRDQWPWLAKWVGTSTTETLVPRVTQRSSTVIDYADTVTHVSQTTVSIFVRRAPAKGQETYNQVYLPEDFRGAGVMLTEDGIGVTTRRAIPDLQKEVAIVTSGRTVFLTKDFTTDPASDVVYFRISGKGLAVADFADPAGLVVSQRVVNVSLDATTLTPQATTADLMSTQSYRVASRPDILKSTEQLAHLFRISRTTAVPAEPTFTTDGKLVGLQVAASGEVIPVDVIRSGLQRLQRDGGVARNTLGVRYLSIPVAQGLLLSPLTVGTRGVLLTGDGEKPAVVPGSPAERAGLRAGDVILRVDDRAVGESPSFSQLIQSLPARAAITIVILRGGEEQRIPVTLDTAAT